MHEKFSVHQALKLSWALVRSAQRGPKMSVLFVSGFKLLHTAVSQPSSA